MDYNDWKYNNQSDSGWKDADQNNNGWKNGWMQTGDQIKEIVDTAIHSGDFKHLNNSVSNMVNSTLDMVKTNLKNTMPYLDRRQGQPPSNPADTNSNPEQRFDEQMRNADPKIQNFQKQMRNTDSQMQNFHKRAQKFYSQIQNPGNRTQNSNARAQNSHNRTQKPAAPALYAKNPPGRTAGILMTVFGFLIMATFLLFVVGFGIAGAVWHLFLTPVIAFSVLTAVGLILGVSGIQQLGFVKRFKQYTFKLRGHIYIPFQSLAEQTGKSIDFTIRDLKKMIRYRFFYQGHLDEENGYFILSDKAWQDYMTEKQNLAARQKELEKAETKEKLSAECQKIMDDGQKYINHIRTCSDLIRDKEISRKLDRMEQVIVRIFEEVRKHPEVASDLHKMMDYYLPTTTKLLDSYRDLDAQPIEGENISSTKREISDTLDTLNTAFEKLLDSLFLNRAWDISSDISVLNTVLAQEGLVEDDFQKETSKKADD